MERVEDIELCRITDVKVKEKVMFLLIRHRVPYAERWDEVPFRNGADITAQRKSV